MQSPKAKIFIGSDHRGFELKQEIAGFLKDGNYDIIDVGPFSYDKEDDYPDYAEKVCTNVLGADGKGILICGSGHGMNRAANKIPGIYASVCWNNESARMAKADGDINVICLSAGLTDHEEAKRIVNTWLSVPFSSEERHKRRLEKIRGIERRHMK